MILCDFQIKAEIERGTLKISPFDESLINPSSLDVRLGQSFSEVVPKYIAIDPTDHTSFITTEVAVGFYTLKPGHMILSSLQEHITLPADISAKILGKSSLGRLGLNNSTVAGWLDPGWGGELCIELFNHSNHPLLLKSGMKIGQLVFYKHCPAQVPYDKKPTSRYMNQSGVVGSKGVS
jgi:dCTP deaminase